MKSLRLLGILSLAAAAPLILAVSAWAEGPATSTAAATLLAKRVALKDALAANPFHRPLHLESTETDTSVKGDAYGLIKQPLSAARALDKPDHWCDLLTLHLNTKQCRSSSAGGKTVLQVSIGKRYDQPLEEAQRVDLVFEVAADTADYLQIKLGSKDGPLGTRDYRIVLEATPAEGGQTFVHFSYSYAYGVVGQLAMATYLGIFGREKVGFTLLPTRSGYPPTYIGGMRGLVERNTMRYYLALEAFLGALSTPEPARTEKSLRDWFTAVEQFPKQLHEMGEAEYLDMKRREYSRQRAAS